ncbi:Inositol phosphoceramide mannosyltransferase 3 OS=Schizosaccharomyces pombe (strain 972 / ATCC 24843) GN=SPAC17G8,11c PE=1 SV=1 [Rhizoctonia solani AG-1 IB]|uniref:Inositol phosphoceramide mannosyltransferase 3 n=1 Tax=Thanatephorus cucumeris (strain AG1-IB / isolate 7/3/14) TaxID=1108050 RepID=M5BV48_THACB|nr:putative glycosyltransferase C17G8.11c [Rhizoctonia solani AG-1 IB]CEL63757.1 Inositol phosphoceramide mannosyltransferase 3 OS=Schizosaccharomyces pombe (strain 972 / ATCC 24843) GN=SPAC17G8,11c PE=1 SV=1 [Rhizoctonia solani AG-1 IB]
MARRVLIAALSILGLFLVGTVIVLSSVSVFFKVPSPAFIYENEVPVDAWTGNVTDAPKAEVIPRIIHQTWKTETLPERWQAVSKTCRDMMPDYDYMLWTDQASDDFIAEHYSWFLPTFRAYTYPIQRADAIRYFVLHHYGGVYLDLDVGCNRRLDPLLTYPVILPKTIPVGVSNDLMFAAKGHPFMSQTIHALMTFDINYVINYPTVMFSTGPMFLSAQLSLFASRNPAIANQVRVLSKPLYGKNAKPDEAPHAFFAHYYGSSWHADDAGFITFLGSHGRLLMILGLALLVFGLYRVFRTGAPGSPVRRRRGSGYTVLLPRVVEDNNGRTLLDLGLFSIPMPATAPSSPSSTTRPQQNILFFLPAILQPGSHSRRNSNEGHELSPRIRSPAPVHAKDLEAGSALGLGLSSSSNARVSQDVRSRPSTPEPRPPPYSAPSASPSSSRWGGWAPWSPAVDRS